MHYLILALACMLAADNLPLRRVKILNGIRSVGQVWISADAQQVATANSDGSINWWPLNVVKPPHYRETILGGEDGFSNPDNSREHFSITKIDFSRTDGVLVAVRQGLEEARIGLWKDGKPADSAISRALRLKYQVLRMWASKDGAFVFIQPDESFVEVIRMNDGTITRLHHAKGHGGEMVRQMAVSGDGRYLVTVGRTEGNLWTMLNTEPSLVFPMKTSVSLVAFSPNSKLLAVLGDGRQEEILIGKLGATVSMVSAPSKDMARAPRIRHRQLAFSPDSKLLAVDRMIYGKGDTEGVIAPIGPNISLWQIDSLTFIKSLPSTLMDPAGLVFWNNEILVTAQSASIHCFLTDGNENPWILSTADSIISLAVVQGGILAASHMDGKVSIVERTVPADARID